jgi:hypothetical protein
MNCCSAEAFVLTTLIKIHEDTAPVILAAGGITLIWGIVTLILARGRASGQGGVWMPLRVFRILLSITAALGLVQAVLGGLVWLQGARPGEGLHYVYGGIVLLAIPVAYVYSDQHQVRRDIIIMVIAVVAVVGAAVRALMTGQP